MGTEPGCVEEALGPLKAALGQLTALMTNPMQYDGEDSVSDGACVPGVCAQLQGEPMRMSSCGPVCLPVAKWLLRLKGVGHGRLLQPSTGAECAAVGHPQRRN